MSDLIVLAFFCFICGLVGTAIGQKKGRSGEAFLLGFLLGPIGWLLVAVGPAVASPIEQRAFRVTWFHAAVVVAILMVAAGVVILGVSYNGYVERGEGEKAAHP